MKYLALILALCPLSFAQANVLHSAPLLWDASTGVSGYNVYQTDTAGQYTAINRLNSALLTSTNYAAAMLQEGNTYYFTVTAVDGNGIESPVSNELTMKVPVTIAPPAPRLHCPAQDPAEQANTLLVACTE